MESAVRLDNINEIIEFCLNEIALEGLEGCKQTDLFELLIKTSSLSVSSLNESSDTESVRIYNLFASIQKSRTSELKAFIWKLIASQSAITFHTFSQNEQTASTSSKKPKKKENEPSKIVNDDVNRGFCADYSMRTCVDEKIRTEDFIMPYDECLNEYGSNLILVADQHTRNKALCPCYKFLDFECINDLEYCILEKIAKSRYDGVYTTSTGEVEGLAKIFNLTPKQLHYTLVQLELHGLIRKQVLKSEKKRSIIYLMKYAFRNKSYLENVCEFLVSKRSDSSEHNYSDSFVNIKKKFHFNNKQFKTLVHNGEKQGLFKRFIINFKIKVKKNSKYVVKTRQSRMLKLTDSYFKSLDTNQEEINEISDNSLLLDNEDDNLEEEDDDYKKANSLVESIGSEQSNTLPLYTQIMQKIESSGKDGISLKKLGHIFGFDFYKSRRLGSNLQTNPEIVTIMKETNHGKAKYQSLVLRRFLKLDSNTAGANETSHTNILSESDQQSQLANSNNSSAGEQLPIASSKSDTLDLLKVPELVLIKRDNQPSKTIQALMSDRSTARKRIILTYLEKNRICTKYEINKEIRRIEQEQSLKGCIDSKTTKRMLMAMEKEKKLHIFTVYLKNVSYMGVRSYDISEDDQIYKNYCLTFKRTFDTVDLKFKTEKVESAELETTQQSASGEKIGKSNENSNDCIELSEDTDLNSDQKSFQLTRSYISSIVSHLKFSTNYSKVYALVPKFQKAIILHRFLHYLLFFYDGSRQDINENSMANTNIEPTFELASKIDRDVVESVDLPGLDRTYQRNDNSKSVHWSTFIPAINRPSSKSSAENNCLFVGEILSHMPVSIFCSIIVINHHVPGLVALLKHPKKRHILVRDLPPSLIAPLIFERRYLRRILSNLQILACLGLITFVESPCNTNQAVNRDVQSQLVYVHRKAAFYDTSLNNAKDWEELKKTNEFNIQLNNSTMNTSNDLVKYEKFHFNFDEPEQVVNYWRKLLHVSMNTYKFSVSRYLHENKRLRQELLCKILPKLKVNEINELWPIEMFSDHMGPGGYSSQLFLNSFKNWILPSNVVANSSDSNKNRNKKSKTEPAITKEADLTTAPYSELALVFPFGIFRGIATYASTFSTNENKNKNKSKKKKRTMTDSEEEEDEDTELVDIERTIKSTTGKRLKIQSTGSTNSAKIRKNFEKISSKSEKTTKPISSKLMKAKYLIDKAKVYKLNANTPNQHAGSSANSELNQCLLSERRAIWQPDEDELILLIKVASLYFLPEEKSVPFKLISDVMNELVPQKCLDKKISSFGRRIKILLKANMNMLFVSNKLELCKQDKELEKKYQEAKLQIKRNLVDQLQVDLYVKFVKDVKEKMLKKKLYDPILIDEEENRFELPATMKEFKEKYSIKNTSKDILMKSQSSCFHQPTTDYEITSNTLHSAIHSSILINDKTPRIIESFNLFDKYSDQLLTDVIYKMSRVHKIIAPTKGSELKKKNVTAFSKHIGKAYHISQRYQYKWMNNISASILNETNKFKNDLKTFNLKKKQLSQSKSGSASDEMFDCTDKDEVGMTSFLAHTIDNSELQVQIDVPNRIWVSKLI